MSKKNKIKIKIFHKELGPQIKEHQKYVNKCVESMSKDYDVYDVDYQIYSIMNSLYCVTVVVKYKVYEEEI